MPARELTRAEREEMSAVNVVRPDRLDVDPSVWTQDHLNGDQGRRPRIRRLQRIFVNAAIKKALCRDATGDRSWLHNVRPYWGHDYHFHIRLNCPRDQPECRNRIPSRRAKAATPPRSTTGSPMRCCIHVLARRSRQAAAHHGELPPECRMVLNAK